jgi:hypothetical protein
MFGPKFEEYEGMEKIMSWGDFMGRANKEKMGETLLRV